ncbi:hypothetical protein AB0M02_28035 [Actinoplanes sp. NPDC051861]|uniref:WXG100 family type VII secretion target n=1 Tax=Actinoplanes sp. NPDC051861 TaxID=3155170 RepID=UPI0034330F34
MTSPLAGVWIAEDVELIRRGVEDGSWVDGTLGVVGAGLDGLAAVVDPVGVLLQSGVAWLIEHVEPLSESLDWLAGDPAAIAANAQTWRDVGGEIQRQAEEVGHSVRFDLAEWTGLAADGYRDRSEQQRHALGALATASETMAAITEGAGFLIAAVRLLVRDAIAALVSRLVVYAAEAAATFGLATPLVVHQATTLIATWTARIANWLRGLLSSLRNLVPLSARIDDLIEQIRRLLRRPALNRVRRRGTGPIQLFALDSVRGVAAKYGIDIAGLDISLGNRSIRGICGQTRPDGSIVLYPTGFRSEEDLARTIAHERFHHDELAAGRPFPRSDEEFSAFEDRAYAHEDTWWENQPIRPDQETR